MSYPTSFVADRTPAAVFAAVLDVRGWWSAEIEGGTSLPELITTGTAVPTRTAATGCRRRR